MAEKNKTGLQRIEDNRFGFVSKEIATIAAIEYAAIVARKTTMLFIFESLVLAFENDEKNKSQFAIQLCQRYARVILPRYHLRFGDEKPFDIIPFSRSTYEIDLIGTDRGRELNEGERLPVVVPPLYDINTNELIERGRCYWRLINK